MLKRLTVRGPDVALTVHRPVIKQDRIVYMATANRSQRYPHGSSKIVYIGTTRNGIDRVAGSAAKQARKLLQGWGLRELTFHRLYCPRRQRLSTWKVLEAGLLSRFEAEYGGLPKGNTNHPSDSRVALAKKCFRVQRLTSLIESLSE